jgi:Domain of unknown function (DUF4352)
VTQHQPPQQPADQPHQQPYQPHLRPPAPRPRRRGRRVLLAAGAVVAVLVVGGALAGNDGNGTSAGTSGGRNGGAEPAAGSTAPAKPADKPRPAGIGQEVRDGKFAFVVTAVDTGLDHVGTDEFTRQTPQGQYVLVHVTVRNIGDEAQLFDASSQKLVDAQGRRYDADSGAAAIALGDSNAFLNTINPGNSVRGILLYDVPKSFVASAIELHDSPFSGGVTVSLAR